jgi:hypothetical protein
MLADGMARLSTRHERMGDGGNAKEKEARQGPIEIFLRRGAVAGSSPERTGASLPVHLMRDLENHPPAAKSEETPPAVSQRYEG